MLIFATSYTQAASLQINYTLSNWLTVLHGLVQSLHQCQANPEPGCAPNAGTWSDLTWVYTLQKKGVVGIHQILQKTIQHLPSFISCSTQMKQSSCCISDCHCCCCTHHVCEPWDGLPLTLPHLCGELCLLQGQVSHLLSYDIHSQHAERAVFWPV